MTGSSFLLLYLALLAVAVVASVLSVRAIRPEGRVADRPDTETLAWLAGGRTRLVDALVAQQLAGGALRLVGRDFVTADGAIEKWPALSRRIAGDTDDLARRLRRARLLADEDEARRLRRWAAGPFVALTLLGLLRLVQGIATHHPVGLLAILLVATLALALIRGIALDRRTRGGHETLRRARAADDRLRRAPTEPEIDRAVALFGTAVVAGSAYAGFHQLRAASGDGVTSSDSGDGGGDGGCGGGCGGCGG